MKNSLVIGLALTACLTAARAEEKAKYEPTSSYDQHTLAGFTVLVSPEALQHKAKTAEALALLEEKLAEVARVLPPDKLKPLRAVKFWVEWQAKKDGAAEYHVSAEWLKDNGYNPDKLDGVEINNVVHFVDWTRDAQPMMILHELAHAYHHRVLGIDHAGVKAAYEKAMKGKLYDSVPYFDGSVKEAYARTNFEEYFAETTEAYFGVNDFFPFSRPELRQHDPAGYALMAEVWGERKDDVKLTIVNDTKKEASIYWLNGTKLVFYRKLKPGEEYAQDTFAGHKWTAVFAGEDGALFTARGFDSTWRLR